MKNPRNLLIFALIGVMIGTGFGYGLRAISAPSHNGGKVTLKTQEIVSVIHQQERDWNAGDIDGFMSGYWQDEALRFSSGGDVTTGWQATLNRYKARYPDKATMGTLDFDIHDITGMGPRNALVKGQWKLTRDKDTPSGLFTLHMQKLGGKWLIVSDHTSSAN